jgi:hypothetical protein
MFKRFATAAVLSALLALPAAAKTVDVSYQGQNAFKDANGQNAWFQNVSYTLNGQGMSASAGLFRFKETDANGAVQNFLAFCLEPLEYLRLPRQHTYGTLLDGTVVGQLGALINNALKMVVDSKSAAAFQLAVWEVANETGGLDLLNGAFKVTSANQHTRNLAQSWLNNLSNGTWKANHNVRILSAPRTQDLVTDLPPIPVPAAGFLLAGGLMGLAALRRRRRTA